MKVMTVDNIITTKNINITHVETYHSDMADHDLMWADIELLDEAAPMIEHDRAWARMSQRPAQRRILIHTTWLTAMTRQSGSLAKASRKSF